MKWLILFSLAVFSLACSHESKQKLFTKASLKCEVKGQELKTGSTSNKAYKRGLAPAYIDSVKIKVHNNEYTVADVEKTFQFVPEEAEEDEGDDIIIGGLTVGNNTITGVGYSKYGPVDQYYPSISAATEEDVNDRATAYAQALRDTHPVYATYHEESPLNKVIYTESSSNQATLAMITENLRVAVVVENTASSQYVLKASILKDTTVVLESSSYIQKGHQDAIVINNLNAKKSISYTVKITYYTPDSYLEMGTIERTIDATASSSITKLYSFNKNELFTGDSSSTITWTPLTDTAEGEEID